MSKSFDILNSDFSPCSDDTRLKDAIEVYKQILISKTNDLGHGEKMLELGAKTETIQELEKLFLNPIQSLVEARDNIDKSLLRIADSVASFYLKTCIESGIIKSAFRKVKGASLYYGITLNKDTFEIRDSVFEFLNFYSSLNLSEKIPVYFQFVPVELINTFSQIEPIA
jgi:hypothetical protein